MTQQRKKCRKGGFTLVELVVTLVILSILFAIAVPSLLGYIHLSQFRKNESYAKTMYLSAESELTYLRTGGEWESFCSKVKKEGVLNQSFDESDEDRKKLVGRIYGIRLDAGEYAEGELSGDGALVGALLSQDTYDKSVLNAAICIEIDVESGQVYSVFYGTNCKGLYYGSNEDSKPADMSGSWLDIDYSKRDRDTRREERLGYYSVQDAVNAVSLDATKLKITSINLVNGETLSLNWSSNVKDQDLDKVYYEVKLYSSEDKAQLLSINIPGRDLKTGSQSVAVTTEDNATKDYIFPVEYDRSNKRATLVLDGMMNAKLYDQLDKLFADNKAAFRQSSDTSITRFGGKLENPLNVYAAVQVFPDPNAENTGGEEYQKSDAIESNKANTLFGDGTRSNNSRCEIETFRHLSNIRYMDTAAVFAVTARSLDWTSDSVKVYGTAARGALSVSAGKDIGFPSIPALRSNQTLDGTGGLLNRIVGVFTGGNVISNLKLDETSIADDAEYLGLFQKNVGTIHDLRLLNPQVEIDSGKLKGVGAVCGYSNGSLKGDTVDGTEAKVEAALTSAQAQGIGGVAGVIEVSDSQSVIKLSASGTVTGTLPTDGTACGIGGIAGSLTTNGAAVKTLTNSAAVTGNRSVGGIAGYFSGKDQATGKDMADCKNEGLILSSTAADDHSLAGHYIGGIVGYAHNASLSECRSRAGYADGYTYKQEDRDKLRGRYVGGIVGYGEQSVLYDCETEANGYVLGSEYVGGIIGALNQSDTQTALLSENGTRTTVNASYVIGNSYVGGIIGENKGGSTIKNCVNTGVVAGYNVFIGGICGANENNAVIINCASYVSDTNNAIYRRVTDWGAVGSYAGGLTGYNSGTITFSDKDNAVSNRSVAGIVVGRHYVGGLVGYNDTDGTIDINYTLIGGRVAATGDCVGGLIGLNASTKLLEKKLTIKPSSVQGRYYVGGAIGANVVNPGENVTVSGLKVDNSLGTVTAEAFCGGLIGYQRTYTEKDRAGGTLYALLPGIAANNSNVPGTVKASTNTHTITITADGNSADRLSAVSNNMTIRAYAYAGGIIGSCEPQTQMKVEHCLNAGGFDRPADDTFPDSKLKTGVDMVSYLQAQKYTDAAKALSDELGSSELRVSVIGGVIGVNGENQVIDHCASKGTMNGLNAMGGVVGLNEGIIRDCTLSGSMGSATQDYIGGIAGLNVGGRTAGTIENCTTEKNCTVTGRNTVGGIVGYNLSGGRIQNNTSSANVSGAGRVGGIAGENGGVITLSSTPAGKRRVNGSGSGVGGVIGVNTATGTLSPASGSVQGDVIAADNRLTVRGSSMVGGIAGINRGTLGGTSINCLTNQAAEVRAAAGSAGGVVGAQEGAKAVLRYAKNLGQVTANVGAAGGIVGMNSASSTVENCIGNGSVTSNDGYAGGVASENYGTIRSCSVGTDNRVTLITRNKTAAGAICAVNHKGGAVQGATLGDHITISGSAFILGAVVGDNSGTVTATEVSQQPTYSVSASTLQVGGAVGINRAGGTVSKVKVTSDFEKFTKYTYLGGVVGQNNASGKVTECTYSGTIDEGKSAVGNCYGGIAGLNGGLLQGSTVSRLTLTADGVYTATSTSSAAEKERLSSHIGGIAGKNDTTGIIEQCYIDNTGTGTITVKNGMVGGVTGYNKGTITMSGDKSTETLMENVSKVSELLANAKAQKLSADSTWVKWADWTDVEKLSYNGGSKSVAADRTMQIIVSSNGNLGGVAGYNAPTGELNRCVSGSWLLVNKSDGIGVGTGGIVGMNESEKDLSYLLNQAFVGRQLANGATSRFAGGIIGTQTNQTTTDWTIENCVNYGTVYGYQSHYSGGIVGQWTNNGGTIENCYNYGNLQTTLVIGWVGASGGIVAQMYHAASGQDFNIISCQNHGSLYGRYGENKSNSANDSAGILGNITAYRADNGGGQSYTINVVDCVNGPGVKIYSNSMASGIVGFFSTDGIGSNESNGTAGPKIGKATENIILNIDRCRNYAQILDGNNYVAGIFGDRYKNGTSQSSMKNTYVQNCLSVATWTDKAIVSLANGSYSTAISADNAGNNYYIDDNWLLTSGRGSDKKITYNSYARNGQGESRVGYSRMLAYGQRYNGTADHNIYAAVVGPRLDDLNINKDTDNKSTRAALYYNLNDNNTVIDDHGIMTGTVNGVQKIIGRVIYYMPDRWTKVVSNYGGGNLQNDIKIPGRQFNTMDEYVRTNYRGMEHSKTASGALDDSFDISLRQNDDGAFNVSITDDDRPLYYEGRVFVNGEEVLSNLRFIPNQKGQGQWDPKLNGTQAYGSGMTSGTFQLPASLAADTAGKTITLSVRAVSLFEDTAPSAWKTAATQNVSVLPTPDVNIRLVSHWNNGAKYQISLKNLADYAVFSNWKVTFRLGSQTVTIDQNNHTAEINGDDLKELIVTAAAGITNGIQPASVTDTIPTDTPKYKPDGSINKLSVSYSGSTVDDCTVTAALTVNESQMETPPIYRIEVLGTVGTNEYVFAYEDVLTSAGNTVTANFRDLPKEYFAENVTNRRVRAWYAASGLGPVYTYGDTRQTGDASVTLRTYSAEGVQQQDKIIYSHVLGHANDFANYIRTAALNIKPLTAPELNDPELMQEDNGSISYRFSWTQPGQGSAVPHYSVKLTGITAAGARIGIPVNEVYGTQENPNTSQSFTISADDWQYTEVELTVTRLGQAYGEVGLSTTKKYAVKQRLERPGQPSVINPDTNELEYTIGWSAIGSENGCAGYQIYVQPEGETAAALGELVPVRGGTCSVSRSLEDYAGKTIDLYLVAVAADDSGYADSPNGIVYTMTVPMRLNTPSVKWSYNWNATANNPIPAADFRSGGLQVTVTPENEASVPPGGSTYLLRAKITGTDGTTVTYPVSAMSESGGSYVCSLTDLDTKYAGCSVRFEARISQSAGQVSSAWVSSGDVVFPRVKLEAPSASLANVNEALVVSYGPMNRLINTAEWDAQLTALSWDEVAEADLYRIELTDKDDKSTTVTVDMSGNLPEIIINGQNTFAVAGDDWYTVKQGSAVNGRYSLTNGSIRYYSYQPDTMLQVKDGTFTLKLPNIFSVVTHENQTLQLTNGIQISRVTVIADSKSDRYTESDPAERRF
ncbi:prepilin-type N-terminal cleavage/methylation domain-containing protein [Butyricicoccus sp. AF22-28AC]|nr:MULTISPECIES: prepilin-type N-terminal cleavage/methylation domain-containing protein [unclassified Butyricicoccus]RHQ74527.1 prepilin-type N-terminal cleavage/methylation domain-containing protein [Butyricicoccus sp. AF24-19AC]RHQ81218.1 prepilin-type N-terminal cleavage/methylation domain-containing protein [Butyricicoccus sp. AF22-28AC]RHR84306.1 prepilin-type N-terminal cleavage/methylation domain-containing protein [Butyricicoccus sp. AF15-40]